MEKEKVEKNSKLKKIGNFLKRNLYFVILFVLLVSLSVVFLFAYNPTSQDELIQEPISQISTENGGVEEVSKQATQSYTLPVLSVKVINDYSGTPILWPSLNVYQVHKAIDFGGTSSTKVLSIASGTIKSIKTTNQLGTVVEIEHSNKMISRYSSLNKDVFVSVGQKVKAGQEIGYMGNSMQNELNLGVHLHFEMIENGKSVDPNLYLTISNK